MEKLGRSTLVMVENITDPDSAERLINSTLKAFGKIDLLVNNAGMSMRGSLESLSYYEWSEVLSVNLTAAFLCGAAAAKEPPL